jgi:capsular exopolysaccharide synthesis family protein
VEIIDLARAVRRFWALALGVLILFLALGAAAAFLPAKQYTSTTILIANPTDANLDITDFDAVRALLPSLIETVDTERFEDEVKDDLDRPVRGDLDIEATIQPGTLVVHMSATHTVPAVAQAMADAAADQFLNQSITPIVQFDVADPAQFPRKPSAPLKGPILLGAGMLGLIAALFSAIGTNALRRRVASADEIRERYGVEVLGEIPAKRRFPASVEELFTDAAFADVVEAYQRLRTNLEIAAKRHLFVAVTSCVQGEGKSTVTANLAWTLASIGHSVVAVDCDLRRPTLHKRFDLNLEKGVSDIADGVDVQSLAKDTDMQTLTVIPAGDAKRHPAEIVSMAFPRLVDELQDEIVLIDTPPMLGVGETTLIATITKAVLLVIDARHRDPAEVEAVLNELRRTGADVLGAVINKSHVSRSRRRSYYYYQQSAKSGRRFGILPNRDS